MRSVGQNPTIYPTSLHGGYDSVTRASYPQILSLSGEEIDGSSHGARHCHCSNWIQLCGSCVNITASSSSSSSLISCFFLLCILSCMSTRLEQIKERNEWAGVCE